MNEAQVIMAGQPNMTGKPNADTLIEASGDMLGLVCMAHDLPTDFDGANISILREPGTNRLMAVIISPVDMHGDEPFARYQINPDAIAKPQAPKLVLTH